MFHYGRRRATRTTRADGGANGIGKVFCMVAALALMIGCSTDARNRRAAAKQSPLPSEAELGEKLVNLPFDQQIAAGAITDRTIYEHHFAGDGISLNALGERQIDMLLEVATDQPIKVNVPDTGGGNGLHEARVDAVRQRLLAGGVDEKRLQVVNTPPGGPGIWTEIVIQTMQQQQQAGEATGQSAGTGTGFSNVSGMTPGGSSRSR